MHSGCRTYHLVHDACLVLGGGDIIWYGLYAGCRVQDALPGAGCYAGCRMHDVSLGAVRVQDVSLGAVEVQKVSLGAVEVQKVSLGAGYMLGKGSWGYHWV